MISPIKGGAPCGLSALRQANVVQRCWVATDGAIGNEKQCLALAHYLGLVPEVFRIVLRPPWAQGAPYWRFGAHRALRGPIAARLSGPLPELLIAAGRRSIIASVAIQRLNQRRTFTVQVLNPRINPHHFDLVVCPRHDALSGDNVITTLGALHRVDAATLAIARDRWQERLGGLPSPHIALLIGASNRAYTLDEPYIERLAQQAEAWAREGSILVTTSRRTPAPLRAFIARRFANRCGDVWTATEGEDNPYLGYLAWADRIIVTADSVNMVSEACGTGKPVHCVPPGPGNVKFQRFHRLMSDRGMVLPLTSDVTRAYTPLRETEAVAAQVVNRILAWRSA